MDIVSSVKKMIAKLNVTENQNCLNGMITEFLSCQISIYKVCLNVISHLKCKESNFYLLHCTLFGIEKWDQKKESFNGLLYCKFYIF